jgi:dihydrofolate reductase
VGKVFMEITMSVDGFSAGPNVDIAHPLGIDGERLHDWMFKNPDSNDRKVMNEMFASTGSFIMGRRTFDLGEGRWGEEGAFRVPCFVLTHRGRAPVSKGPTTFTFVTDGIVSALEKAKAAARDEDVCVMGGANVTQQYLKAGLVEEIRLHIATVLLGSGTRLFENVDSQPVNLERTRVITSPLATHLNFRVIK